MKLRPGKNFKLVCVSDTHGAHGALQIPSGDFFIHAGDFTENGTIEELIAFNSFLKSLPHRHKIVVAGNHDWCFQNEPALSRKLLTEAIYLQDEAIELDGLLFYGSPWQPRFMNWAFNLPRGEMLAKKWALIPPKTDILITHSPPFGIADKTKDGVNHGCKALRDRIEELQIKLHIFGHIHEGRGTVKKQGTEYINTCKTCTLLEK